jgi:hypothetical protein
MRHIDPRLIIVLGLVLVLFGFAAPFLMVMRIIEPNFPLSFLSHAASVGGLFLGLLGVSSYGRIRRG